MGRDYRLIDEKGIEQYTKIPVYIIQKQKLWTKENF